MNKVSEDSDVAEAHYRFSDGLRIGDIILSTIRTSLISRTIRDATGSAFSHAAIYRGEYNVLEAIGAGVTSYNVMRRGVHDLERVRVLRLSLSNGEQLARAAVDAAQRYRKRSYWTAGALRSLFGNPKDDEHGRMFCSFFVAQSYADAGVTLCPGLAPRNVTPANLAESSLLEDVTRDVLVAIASWQPQRAFEAIDEGQVTTPAHRLLQLEQEVAARANEILAREHVGAAPTLDDVIRVLVLDVPAARQPAVDRALCRALAQPFQDLIDAVVAVWSALPPEQFVVDPADMPLSALQATFASHLQLRDKWQDRRGDQRAEAAAIQQLYEETRLQCCQFWIQRNLADADLLERALLELENTIVTLGTVLDERQRRSG